MELKDSVRRRVAIACLLMPLLSAAGRAPASADQHEASQLVQRTAEQVPKSIRTGGPELTGDRAALHFLVEQAIVGHFDFEAMSRLVLGKYWRQAASEQQRRFVAELRSRLVRTYTAALVAYADEEIVFQPVRGGADDDHVLVTTEIRSNSGRSVPVTYRMYSKDDSWKVYDVAVDGISLVTTYRAQFSQHVRQRGFDSLVELLATANDSEET